MDAKIKIQVLSAGTLEPVNCLKGIAGLFLILKHGVFKSGCIARDLLQLSCF